MLSISDYDRAEAAAIVRASYPAIRAFRPIAFTAVNFPMRVTEEAELVRYCDIMNEIHDRDFWYRRMTYSRVEGAMISGVADVIERITDEIGGVGVRPFMAMFPCIPVVRAVSALGGGRTLRVIEVGSGSGQLGAYLIARGHVYTATDSTQALYLWQNRLFGAVAEEGGFVDFVEARRTSRVTLMPWWHFAELYRDPPAADVVICDGAMGEMDVFAVNYILRLAARMLEESPVGAFLFQNIGEPRVTGMAYVESRLDAAGFRIRQVLGPVTVCSQKPLEVPRVLEPVGGSAELQAADFLPIDRARLLDSYSFFDFIRLTET
jgi:SAM-dependent methyltransferase